MVRARLPWLALGLLFIGILGTKRPFIESFFGNFGIIENTYSTCSYRVRHRQNRELAAYEPLPYIKELWQETKQQLMTMSLSRKAVA